MFGFGKKKKLMAVTSDEATKAFKEANQNFLNSLAVAKELQITIKQIDNDILYINQVVIALTQAVNGIDTRVRELENRLLVTNIKFTGN